MMGHNEEQKCESMQNVWAHAALRAPTMYHGWGNRFGGPQAPPELTVAILQLTFPETHNHDHMGPKPKLLRSTQKTSERSKQTSANFDKTAKTAENTTLSKNTKLLRGTP